MPNVVGKREDFASHRDTRLKLVKLGKSGITKSKGCQHMQMFKVNLRLQTYGNILCFPPISLKARPMFNGHCLVFIYIRFIRSLTLH